MRCAIGNAEADGDDIEEGVFRQFHAFGFEIFSGIEFKPIFAGLEGFALQQRRIDAAVGVGFGGQQQFVGLVEP